jgi:hypothetical protein
MSVRGTHTRYRVAAGLVVVALMSACGGGGGGAKAAAPTTTIDAAKLKSALEARLLTPADLTTGDALDVGWEHGDAGGGVDIKLPDCVQENAGSGAVTSAASDLIQKTDLKLPAVQEDLSSYSSGGAQKAFTAAEARLDSCQPTFVFQGTPSTGKIERLPLTVGSQQSQAWRTTVTIAGAAVSITSIHVQQGDVEMALVHVDLGTPDTAAIEALGAKALAKLG